MKPYYQTDRATLYCGDCLEVLPTLEADSVDAVVTDPPYFLPATHYNVRSGTFRSLGDLCILEHFFRDVFKAARSVLSDSGFVYVFCDGQSYPAFYATAYAHFRNLRPLVWDKQTSINGYAWRHQHELILFGTSEDSPAVPTGDGDVIRCRAVKIGQRDHLAEKPVELLAKLIGKTTPPAGLCLDPFAGSGTTGVACLQTGRRFLGVELSEQYCEIAAKRLEKAAAETPLFTEIP